MASAYSSYNGASRRQQRSNFTITALGRWSSLNKTLPAAHGISALHVYDFDNTLFKTPLPNPALWNGPTIGMLSNQDVFINGGWWHDDRILGATGQGLEKEEPRAWEGWWNENIVELVRLSMKQPDALTVLLTGRSEPVFADLLRKMTASKELDFDMLTLKPPVSPTNQRFQSTMHFKQIFLNALMETYSNAKEIRVYEDRPKHTKGFRDFFAEYNRLQTANPSRGPLTAEVIQVADTCTTLDPVTEVAEVQLMINQHNDRILQHPIHLRPNRLRIKKTVFFTSYMISPEDTERLLQLATLPPDMSRHDLKLHGNNILICPRPCPKSILDKVGGMGSKMTWEVTGTACLNKRVWAACVQPVPLNAPFHSDNPVPLVVLALRKGARPMDAGKINTWSALPTDKRFSFETTVGEKVILRIETDDPREDEYESLFANKTSKRKHNTEDDWAAKSGQQSNNNRGGAVAGAPRGPAAMRVRGGQARGRGGRGGRGVRGRGRGFNHYRSLDDVEPKNQHAGGVNYDENFPPVGPANGQQQGRPMGSGQQGNSTDLQDYY